MYIDRAVIEINGGCNYTCKMCPQTTADGKTGARGKDWLKKMPLDMFEDAIRQTRPRVVNLEGSGEPTLNRDLPRYIEIVKKYDAKAYIFSNGLRMQGKFMRDCVDAGLDFYRFSIIGYNAETYSKWMSSPNFDRVIDNMKQMRSYATNCAVASYHLILNNDNLEYEKEQYLKLSEGGLVEIWKMHNWSGVYSEADTRNGKLKTCGRPFSPDIVIRAGGVDGETGAVHPCCQVMGNDDAATLGHMSENTIEEIWNGPAYEALRDQHSTGDFPDFCKGCDFLIDDPEVLVYSNHAKIDAMHGTDFSLSEYKP
jgi:wyosine [tRNA(Phe)-imidazoG37] synthetase (radical SAM superfamily)